MAYYEGIGTDKHYVEALRWYNIAASSGHQGALYNVGLILAQGTDAETAAILENSDAPSKSFVKADIVSAIEYFQAVAFFNVNKLRKTYINSPVFFRNFNIR
jgi:TPR repeat protein